MKQIPLTKGKFALVDDEDFDWLMQWKWYAVIKINTNYAVRSEYNNITKKSFAIPMSNEILKHYNLMNNLKIVDHKNGNGLDNRKENLRPCTFNQNMYNKKTKLGSCSYKGIRRRRKVIRENNKIKKIIIYDKWISYIKFNKKQIYLGHFSTEKEAAVAYNEGALKYFGEFAKLNEVLH